MSQLVTRVGLIGDVHCQADRLECAVAFLREQAVEAILVVGDVVDGPGDVDRTIEILLREQLPCVQGNHDRWLLLNEQRTLPHATPLERVSTSARAYLAALPVTIDLPTPRGWLLLCHGLGDNDMAKVGPDDFGYAIESNSELQQLLTEGRYALVCNGHTHRAMCRQFGLLHVVNAGTLLPGAGPGLASVDLVAGAVRLFDFAADDQTIVEAGRSALHR